MSKTITLAAHVRQDTGKGASRRLRREGDFIPAILYGGEAAPQNLKLEQRHVRKAAEQESFYASILSLDIEGRKQKAVLKAVQRHPYKPFITHLDFFRVSGTDVINMRIPLHFINEKNAPGLKEGGIMSHNISDVEIKCQAKDLPEFIDVDLSHLELNAVIHLSDLKLPNGVELTAEIGDAAHDHPVASVHLPKAARVEEEDAADEATPSETSGEASTE